MTSERTSENRRTDEGWRGDGESARPSLSKGTGRGRLNPLTGKTVTLHTPDTPDTRDAQDVYRRDSEDVTQRSGAQEMVLSEKHVLC